MRKTKSTVTAIGIALAIVLVGGWAFAHGPWRERGYGRHGYGYGDPYSNLSSEQREKLQAQEEKFYQDTAELRRELYQKRLELQGLWIDPKADPEKIKTKQREVFELQSRIQDKALEHKLAARELLPEGEVGQGPMGWGHGMGPGSGMGFGPHHGGGHMGGSGAMRGYGAGPCW
ncbi:MAG: Spy/CpxP family protein refolding chaperone [Thermodesulfobacteriota bacterium]